MTSSERTLWIIFIIEYFPFFCGGVCECARYLGGERPKINAQDQVWTSLGASSAISTHVFPQSHFDLFPSDI